MDDDLDFMTQEELINEVKKLRSVIREHRDNGGQDLCWHHPSLWEALPEKADPFPPLPDWPDFIRGCVNYRQSLDQQLRNKRKTDVPGDQKTPQARRRPGDLPFSPEDLVKLAELRSEAKRSR
ncbi:MAG: hypothetical protein WA987_09975 [Cellvibrio sp.]|jgi:hypothetical protein